MKGKIWILSLYLFLPLLLRGQSNGMGLSPLITPPPEAASITRYGLYPVSLFTGLPSISIPVYTIKVRDFSLPISFDYHASGIKVDEFASWVGLGWSLNAGGAITRTVMGIPDDDPYGIFYNPVKREGEIVSADYPMFERIRNRLQDSEPDVFYYNFAGQSGQFTIAPNKEVKNNSHTNLKINYIDGVFSAVDPNGITYWFEKKGTTSAYAENGGVKYWPTTTWMLSKIILSNKVDTISFGYTEWSPGRTQTIDYHLSLGRQPVPVYNFTKCPTDGCPDLQWESSSGPVKTVYFNEFSNYYVNNIVFPGGKVRFVAKTTGRLDMGGSILDSVIVENAVKPVKKMVLTHDFFYSNDGFNPYASAWDRYRLKLTGVKEVGVGSDSALTYRMVYEEQFKLPPRMNCGVDWWGYSNGQIQNQQLLSLDDNGNQYTYRDVQGFTTPSGITPAAIRTPDENNMRAGTLKRIYYPAGGYTDFELEANRILLQKTVPKGGGSYLVAAKKDDPPGVSYRSLEFTSPVTIPINDPSPAELKVLIPLWNSITKPYILFENLTTGVSQTYNTIPGDQVSRTIKVALIEGQNYRITASISPNPGDPNDNPDAEVVGTLTWTGRGVDVINVVQMGPGLRIKTIKSYTASDSLVKREDYKYGENESGNGKVSFFNYLFEQRTYEQRYNLCWGGRGFVPNNDAPYSRLEILSKPLFSYSDIGGSSIFYPQVAKYETNGTANNGKTVYKYDYELDQKLDYRYPDPQLLISSAWRNGNLLTESISKKVTDTTYQLIRETSNQYQTFYLDTVYGLKVVSQVIYPNGRECVGGATADPSRFSQDFGYFEYPIISGVKKMISSTIKTFTDNKDSLTVTTNYSYQNLKHLLPTAIETKNSKGVSVKTTMKYAQDKSDITSIAAEESTAIDSMVKRNIVETLIEKDEYTNDILMQRTHFEYSVWGSTKYLIALKKAKQKLATNNMEDHFEIIDYDKYGNVLERSNSNNVHEVYYWGYNDQYPVAKVLNSSYALVKSLLNNTIIQNPSSDDVLQTELNKLRVNAGLNGSQVTTYAYDPLLGVSNIVDEKGRNIYYKYDGFGRLAFIKDQNGKILKLYDYKYQVPLNQ